MIYLVKHLQLLLEACSKLHVAHARYLTGRTIKLGSAQKNEDQGPGHITSSQGSSYADQELEISEDAIGECMTNYDVAIGNAEVHRKCAEDIRLPNRTQNETAITNYSSTVLIFLL